MLYENDKPIKVTSVVISTQHSKDLNQDSKRINNSIHQRSIPENYLQDLNSNEIYINPRQFIIGGPDGDTVNRSKNYS